jgi:chitodextrinase
MAQLGAGSDTETVTALRVVGDHASNRIALASGDGAALVVQMWDGGQWIGAGSGAPFTVTSEMAAEGRGRSFDLAWEGGSGDLTAVYSPRSLTDGVSRSWSSTGGWTAPAPLPAPAAETIVATILSSAIAAADASVLVVANAALPDTGLIRIDAELIRYSTRTSNAAGTALTLGGLTRGEFGSVAAAHAAGAAVEHVPYPAWFDLAAARGVDEAALASLDTQGRVVLRRWNGAAWTAAVEAQAQGAGLVAVFDSALARTSLAAGRAIAATLAQHLAGPGPGITPPSTVPDTTPPAAPTLGAGSPGVTSVLLSWTAVGDDGTTGGMVARYELRRSFGTLSAVQQVAAVAAPGATEQFTASGLDGGTTYTFELRAIDDAGNASAWSSPTIVTTAVDQPPTAVTLSLAAAPTTNAITIQWTVPPDDSGPIAGYLVRYSAGASFNFDTATPYTLHLPTVVGSNATLAIQGLLPATSYAIAVKAVDAAAQVGASSNVLIATTAVGSSADVTPPAAVTDLAVFGGATTSNSLLLQWTATGDPVGAGTFRRARAYEVRYATVPLTADNFSQGTLVGSNPPGLPGGAQELLVGGLSPNATYYFALVVVDGSGNRSPLSNVVMGRTALRRGYTIVSVPLLLTNPNTPDAVFGDDVGIPPYAYRWNSTGPAVSDGCYAGTVSQPAFPTCASLTAIETGAAYYLYSAGNRAVLDATGSAVTAPTFEVPLALGFNMVGNPYGREIPLSAIRVKRASSEVSFAVAVAQGWVSGAIYLYDGAAHQAYGPADPEAVFRPWNGAWIQSSVADAILVFEQP